MTAKKNVETRVSSGPDIHKISDLLERAYESPRHGNPRRPLDDLIYIILSTRTRDASFRRTFRTLKRTFPNWNIFPKDRSKMERILVPGGLGRLKARQLVSIVSA